MWIYPGKTEKSIPSCLVPDLREKSSKHDLINDIINEIKIIY